MLTRRTLIGSAAALLLPARAIAAQTGFAIDWQGGPQTPQVAASLAAQIAPVRAIRLAPAVAAFFAAQPITVDLAEGTRTRTGPRGIFFERRALPPDNPVLLHELIHRFHLLQLPQGFANPEVRAFYAEAKASGRYPADAYMLTNPPEFLAMTASTILHGRAARAPYLRANVERNSPDLARWIMETFVLPCNGRCPTPPEMR